MESQPVHYKPGVVRGLLLLVSSVNMYRISRDSIKNININYNSRTILFPNFSNAYKQARRTYHMR